MFQVGEKIIYPMYGAGVIEEIEEKKSGTQTELYYIIQLPKKSHENSFDCK